MAFPTPEEWGVRYRPAPSAADFPELICKEPCALAVRGHAVPATLTVKGARLSVVAGVDTRHLTIIPCMRIKRVGSRAISIKGIWEPPDIDLTFEEPVSAECVAGALHEALTQVVQSLFAPLVARLGASPQKRSSTGRERDRMIDREYGLPLAGAHFLHMPPMEKDSEPSYELRFVVLVMADYGPECRRLPMHHLRIYLDEHCDHLLYFLEVGQINRVRMYRSGFAVEVKQRRRHRLVCASEHEELHRLVFASAHEGELWGSLLREVASVDPGEARECTERAPIFLDKGRVVEEEGVLAKVKSADARRHELVQPLLDQAQAPPPWHFVDPSAGDAGVPEDYDTGEGFDVMEVLAGKRSDDWLAALHGGATDTCCVIMDD